MEYKINYSCFNGAFIVPDQIVGDYICSASGIAIKVLLIILKNNQKNIPAEEIAAILSIKTEDAIDAINYWISNNVLIGSTEKLAEPKVPDKKVIKIGASKPSPNLLSSKEAAQIIKTDHDANILIENTQALLGRPLTTIEMKTMIYAYQYTSLPVDVILMIVDYSVRIEKTSPQYILKLCTNWSEEGINTHEKAEVFIKQLMQQNHNQKLVRACFGIGDRNLSKKETDFINKWFDQYKFEINMIRLAYEKTIDAIGKLSFAYINKILGAWHDQKMSTPEQVLSNDKTNKKTTQKNSTSYDLDALAKRGFFVPEVE